MHTIKAHSIPSFVDKISQKEGKANLNWLMKNFF